MALGPGAAGLSLGAGVRAYYYLSCGYCQTCLSGLEPLCEDSKGNVGRECDGGYAEYLKLPAHLFIPLPEGWTTGAIRPRPASSRMRWPPPSRSSVGRACGPARRWRSWAPAAAWASTR